MAERTKKAGKLKETDWKKIREFAQLSEYQGRDKMAFISKGLGWSPATISRVLNTESWSEYKGLIAHVGEEMKSKRIAMRDDVKKEPELKSSDQAILTGILKALFAIKDELKKGNELNKTYFNSLIVNQIGETSTQILVDGPSASGGNKSK